MDPRCFRHFLEATDVFLIFHDLATKMHHHEQHRKDYVWHIVVMMWLANAGECFVFEITLKMNTA